MTSQRARFFIRLAIGLFFVAAASTKIYDPSRFLTALLAYALPLPDFFLRLTAIALPWLELFCGALLLANVWPEVARRWILLLTLVFIVITAQAMMRGLNISCGCIALDVFGLNALSEFLERPTVAFARNIAILAGAVYIKIDTHDHA